MNGASPWRPGPRAWLAVLLVSLSVALLSACSRTQPQTAAEHVSRGDRYLAAGDANQAIASYRMAFYQDSLDARVLGRLATAYAQQGNTEAADTYLRRATGLTYQAAVAAMERGDTAAALASLELTVELHPAHPLALNQLGDLALAHGDQAKALDYYERSTRANPHYAESFIRLGRLYATRGSRAAAEQAFHRAIDANLNAAEAYLELGRLYLADGKWAAAAEQFDKVLRIDPRSMVARAALDQAQQHL